MRSDGGILFLGMTASFGFVLLLAGLWLMFLITKGYLMPLYFSSNFNTLPK